MGWLKYYVNKITNMIQLCKLIFTFRIALNWPVRPLFILLHLFFETHLESQAQISLCRLITEVFAGRQEDEEPLPSYHSAYLDLSQFPTSLWLGSSSISFPYRLSGCKTVRLNPFWLPLTAETCRSTLISKDALKHP